MHFILVLLTLLIAGSLYINAMPAYSKEIPINVGDSVVYIRLFGDEHNKRAESVDGFSLVQKDGEWYFAEKDAEGWLMPSNHKLSASLENECKQFLTNTPKHLTNNLNTGQFNNSPIVKTSQNHNVHGNRRVLVILMQYTDLSMLKSQDDFYDLFNGIGYSADGARGSVRDFYTDVSYGQLLLTCDLIGPFTSKHDRKYYGENNRNGNDCNPYELFKEAINYAAEYVSLKDYDADGDGYVDNIHIVFAGHGEEAGASDDAIWSHEATFYQDYEIQGIKINRYSCAPELRGNSGSGISRIGPHCHEIGHALGAMDYYDTNYDTDGKYIGTGDWDIMASGSWNNEGITPADFNPYVKTYNFGWVTPKDLPSGNVTISPSYIDSDNYYILKSQNSTDYYLIENRSRNKWGYGVPGEGMLVFHIHPEIATSGGNINSGAPQKCYVVCASSRTGCPDSSPSSYGDINSNGCPYPGSSNNTNFGQGSIPIAFFWDNTECGIELNNISIDAEKNIHLENNSAGIEEDIERRNIFFEGFEDNNIKISILNDNSLSPTWTIITNPQVPSKFPEHPSAFEGSRSLQLSAKKVTEKAVGQFCFTIPEVTEGSQLMIKLHANTLNPMVDTPNIIKVGYHTKDNNEWQYSEIFSTENNLWHQFIVKLPENILSEIQVEGTAYAGSILAIDNIEVEEIIDKNVSGIQETLSNANSIISVYSLAGYKQRQLQRGFNIIRSPNGFTIKTFSK